MLKQLAECYKEDSNKLYNVMSWGEVNTREEATKLLRAGLLRELEIDGDVVRAAISIQGLERVDPKFVSTKMFDLLSQTGDADTIWNVVELLGAKEPDFQFCFDLANELQNRDLVKLLYAFYPTKVMVEMTLKGVEARKQGPAYWPAI